MPDESIKIVIVEDHEFTRIGLKMFLEKVPDFAVIGEASDGKEAVDEVLRLQPRVVLMDIGLPTIDGIEATRQIKKTLPDVKIIMLTSHNSDEDIFAALSANANGYCLKNVASNQLESVIRTVAEGAAWLDPGIANRVLCAFASPEKQPVVGRAPRAKSVDAPLSPRETEVLRLVAAGLSNQQIAERLDLGLETIKTHIRHIMEKLTVSDRTQAAVKAMKQGLV
jgi:DNA-binding NarL/FixJ family response regulator